MRTCRFRHVPATWETSQHAQWVVWGPVICPRRYRCADGILMETHTCTLVKMVFVYRWAAKTASWLQGVKGLQRAPDRRLGCVLVSWATCSMRHADQIVSRLHISRRRQVGEGESPACFESGRRILRPVFGQVGDKLVVSDVLRPILAHIRSKYSNHTKTTLKE